MSKLRHGAGRRFSLACAIALFGIVAATAQHGFAAGGAFAVDDAGVDAPGDCKVEAFAAFARNDDFAGVVAPACVVSLGRPVDLGLQVDRARAGGEWGTGLSLKAKTPIVPFTDEARFGMAIAGGVGFDLTAHETAEWFLTVPASVRLGDTLQLNLNVGVLRDQIDHRTLVTWGAGFESAFAEHFTLLGEVFGQNSEPPGAQIGLRFTPHARVDFDVIYGRNLTGERLDWVTFGVNRRF